MLEKIEHIARQAGDVILTHYSQGAASESQLKADNSPLTAADLAANQVILAELAAFTPDIPILSEEAVVEWAERKNWQRYWLVDPLDGTKEFIKRNGEFTVNIALIEAGKPVLGVVYAPVMDTLYSADDTGAWKQSKGQRQSIQVARATLPLVVISRSHAADDLELKDYLQQLGEHQTVAIGSSLKFCLVAEGSAQLYPRFGPTNIWDTAAGHAIALAAGGQVNDWHGKALDYTPRESFINPGFRVSIF